MMVAICAAMNPVKAPISNTILQIQGVLSTIKKGSFGAEQKLINQNAKDHI